MSRPRLDEEAARTEQQAGQDLVDHGDHKLVQRVLDTLVSR